MKIRQGFATNPRHEEMETCSTKSSKEETTLGAKYLSTWWRTVIKWAWKFSFLNLRSKKIQQHSKSSLDRTQKELRIPLKSSFINLLSAACSQFDLFSHYKEASWTRLKQLRFLIFNLIQNLKLSGECRSALPVCSQFEENSASGWCLGRWEVTNSFWRRCYNWKDEFWNYLSQVCLSTGGREAKSSSGAGRGEK